MSGTNTSYSFTVTPSSPGNVTVYVPAGVATDSETASGLTNTPSQLAVIEYDPDAPAVLGPFGSGIAASKPHFSSSSRSLCPPSWNAPLWDI